MSRTAARSSLNRSQLIRFLTDNELIDATAQAEDVGHRLGDWLNFRQAIALHKLLTHAPSPITPPGRRAAWMRAEDLNAHVYKVRTALEQSILQGAAPGSGWSRIELPRAELGEPMDPQTAFEPYRRYLNAHQRQMAAVISTLRQQVRGQVSKLPALQALAALDAQFESILNDRETMWLGKVTPMLEKRFHQALKQHLKNQTEAPAQATTLRASNAPDWLTPMRQQLQNALLAELDTRLQPTLGLLEAFTTENSP
jgi:hypothetical protein